VVKESKVCTIIFVREASAAVVAFADTNAVISILQHETPC
jgi:hypothetical protein